MTSFQHSKQRGATRHWVIGCLSVVVLIVVIIGVGMWFAYREVRKKMDFGMYNVATKVDPPAEASTDLLLPTKAGTFERIKVTSNTAEVADLARTVPGNPQTHVTSGTMAALYQDPDKKSALVITMTSDAARESGQQANSPLAQFGKKSGNSDGGFHVQSKFQGAEFGMAGCTKGRWTYLVLTTDTQALEFANKFEPGK